MISQPNRKCRTNVNNALENFNLRIEGKYIQSILNLNENRPIYVTADIAQMIYLHLVKNFIMDTRSNAALILAITGPFGIGKSAVIKEVLRRLGIITVTVGASELESEWAGKPSELLKNKYKQASKIQKDKKQPCCIVIDDIDLAMGFFSEFASGTTNTRHLLSCFMELADNPYKVDGTCTDRIPIIFTCNDLSKIYGAVKRPRRMRAWHYNPSASDITAIGRHILRCAIDEGLFNDILPETQGWTPADYAQLLSVLQEYMLGELSQNYSADVCIHTAFKTNTLLRVDNYAFDSAMLHRAVLEVKEGIEETQKSYV